MSAEPPTTACHPQDPLDLGLLYLILALFLCPRNLLQAMLAVLAEPIAPEGEAPSDERTLPPAPRAGKETPPCP
jgi:hypothetical protein